MSKVRVLKLTNSEVIIAHVMSEKDGVLTLKKPALLHAVPSQTNPGTADVAFIPWTPFYDNFDAITLPVSFVMTGLDLAPNKGIEQMYQKETGAIIQPNSGLIF